MADDRPAWRQGFDPSEAAVMLSDARMVTAHADRSAAVRLSRSVQLDGRTEILEAVLRATAHGIYEITIDGRPISNAVLSPPWTSFEWRLEVQERDVTELLRSATGKVNIDVLLGNGWWRGDLGSEGQGACYGDDIGFLCELVVTFADGTTQRVATDTDWSATTSEVTANNLYGGQRIDSRLIDRGSPLLVRAIDFDRTTLVAQVGPDATRHDRVRPVAIWSSTSSKTLVDFGQNLVGWVRLRANGVEGAEIVVRHAEVLEHGELGTRPLRGAGATDVFVLSGGDDVFEPTLTFHGFRYAEVDGFPGDLTADDLEAVVVHSDIRRTGWFECSDPLVNRLVENSVWSQRGNFLHVPTDCPQRDERLGWTGDIAAYAPTACFQFDCADLLHRWLLDLERETRSAGCVPFVVPDVLKLGTTSELYNSTIAPTAIWGDAAIWVPEALWKAYGDLDRLTTQYPGMVLHLESVLPRLSDTGLWDSGFQFGDWLDPDAPPDRPWAAKADRGVVATACLYRSASFAADAARLLGLDRDADRWSELARRTRAAFTTYYIGDDGAIRSDAPTAYALAIVFGLLHEEHRAAAGDRLATLVAAADHRVSTGFAGTPYITWALSETGHVDDAYQLLLQTKSPSWLHPITIGATTIWERWDSMLPDGSINPGDMTSFNHYALGSVADWLYQVVAGIRPSEPGYSRVLLQPTPGHGLDWANAALETPHGRVECGWRRTEQGIEVTTLVPTGVEAELVLPDGARHLLCGGAHVRQCGSPA